MLRSSHIFFYDVVCACSCSLLLINAIKHSIIVLVHKYIDRCCSFNKDRDFRLSQGWHLFFFGIDYVVIVLWGTTEMHIRFASAEKKSIHTSKLPFTPHSDPLGPATETSKRLYQRDRKRICPSWEPGGLVYEFWLSWKGTKRGVTSKRRVCKKLVGSKSPISGVMEIETCALRCVKTAGLWTSCMGLLIYGQEACAMPLVGYKKVPLHLKEHSTHLH